jgi:hypothetical protein
MPGRGSIASISDISDPDLARFRSIVIDILSEFEPLLGFPAWKVQNGYGSFITMEFGEPMLRIDEARLRPVFIEGAPKETRQRLAIVRGTWHLWIYCCSWSLLLDGLQIAHNESEQLTMNRALHVLNGQRLSKVSVIETANTRFEFDLGCVLDTSPAAPGTYDDEPVEQWLLYQPSGRALSLRGDGAVTSGDSSSSRADSQGESEFPSLYS